MRIIQQQTRFILLLFFLRHFRLFVFPIIFVPFYPFFTHIITPIFVSVYNNITLFVPTSLYWLLSPLGRKDFNPYTTLVIRTNDFFPRI